MGKRNRFRFNNDDLIKWGMPLLSIVILILSAFVLSKVKNCNNEGYSVMPGYAPPEAVGEYKGPWNANLCKNAFTYMEYDPKKQKSAIRNISADSSDYPMHFCGGPDPDNLDGQNSFNCAMIPGAGANALGSATCQRGYGVAFSPEECDAPKVSSGRMYCSDFGFYDCDSVCGQTDESPVVVDPEKNIWGFDHVCGNVQNTTPGLITNCPIGKPIRQHAKSLRKDGLKADSILSISLIVLASLVAVGAMVGSVIVWRRKK